MIPDRKERFNEVSIEDIESPMKGTFLREITVPARQRAPETLRNVQLTTPTPKRLPQLESAGIVRLRATTASTSPIRADRNLRAIERAVERDLGVSDMKISNCIDQLNDGKKLYWMPAARIGSTKRPAVRGRSTAFLPST